MIGNVAIYVDNINIFILLRPISLQLPKNLSVRKPRLWSCNRNLAEYIASELAILTLMEGDEMWSYSLCKKAQSD